MLPFLLFGGTDRHIKLMMPFGQAGRQGSVSQLLDHTRLASFNFQTFLQPLLFVRDECDDNGDAFPLFNDFGLPLSKRRIQWPITKAASYTVPFFSGKKGNELNGKGSFSRSSSNLRVC